MEAYLKCQEEEQDTVHSIVSSNYNAVVNLRRARDEATIANQERLERLELQQAKLATALDDPSATQASVLARVGLIADTVGLDGRQD